MELLISQMESVSLFEPDEYELLLFYFNLNYEDNHIEYYLEQTKNRYKRYLLNIENYMGHNKIKSNMKLYIETFKNKTTLLYSFHLMKITDRMILNALT